jgi:hypothetical protein
MKQNILLARFDGLKTFDPRILLGDRFELVLYIFCAKCIINNTDIDKAKYLYTKFLKYFPGEWNEHNFSVFTDLVISMKSNGYNPYHPVEVNPENYFLVNGSHRCSSAIALGFTSIPYSLTMRDDNIPLEKYLSIFSKEEYEFLLDFQHNLISNLPDHLRLICNMRIFIQKNPHDFKNAFSSPNIGNAYLFYQGDPLLGISGKRNVRMRWKTYNLACFLNGSEKVLELGCNIGLFSNILSNYVHELHGYDINSSYIDVAHYFSNYMKNNNLYFKKSDLKEINPRQKYDVIISCAVHGWSGLDFDDYCKLLICFAKPNAIILFESHEILAESDWQKKRSFLLTFCECLHSGFIDDVDSRYASEIREFLVLRLKENFTLQNKFHAKKDQTFKNNSIKKQFKDCFHVMYQRFISFLSTTND